MAYCSTSMTVLIPKALPHAGILALGLCIVAVEHHRENNEEDLHHAARVNERDDINMECC
eukprot:4570972-Amphidinium_carterae.1